MGKVISTLAQTNAAYTFDQEPLDYLILSRFSPQEAMGLTMLAIWCLSVMTGVVSYAGNFLVHRDLESSSTAASHSPRFCSANFPTSQSAITARRRFG